MRRAGAIAAFAALVFLAPAAARAQVQDHDGQPGLRAGIGTGLSYVLDYDTKATDLGRAPFAVNAWASYGLTSAVEIELGGVFSLERPAGERPIAGEVGVRYFYNPLSFFKLYSTLGAVVPVKPRIDLGLHNEDGVQYDINSHIGLFFGLDLSVLFVREFAAGAGVLAGAQGRF